MWVSLIRSTFAIGALGLMMFVLAYILSELTSFATSGPNADHETVVQLSTMFDAMTVDNLTLLAAFAVVLFLLWRATVEGQRG